MSAARPSPATPSFSAASPVFVGGHRSRLVHVDDFEEAVVLTSDERAAYRRRFVTLFADDTRRRRGGLGEVGFATNAVGELLAIKTLVEPVRAPHESESAHARRTEIARAAFQQEYECHRALSGFRGFPRLYGRGTVDGTPVIVMEWVEGQTLEEACRELAVDDEGRLSPVTVARLGADLFELLARLSLVGEGVVHRDVSPTNVMLRTGRVSVHRQAEEGSFDLCLIDFGSSAEVSPDLPSFTRAHSAARGATAAYAPPEMLSDDLPGLGALRRSPAIDVYAAASVLFELLDGRPPFTDCLEKSGSTFATLSSPYRLKVDERPGRPVSAHAGASDFAQVLAREPEVGVAVGRAVEGMVVAPSLHAIQAALALVDEQLADVLLDCLDTDQARRPGADQMRDALRAFCAHYPENVWRALRHRPLTSCLSSDAWLSRLGGSFGWRAVRLAARAVAALAWVGVAGTAAWLLDGAPFSGAVGPLTWEGTLGVPAIVALLAVPAAGALLARGRAARTREGFVRATATLVVLGLAAAVVASLLGVGSFERLRALLAALLACVAATWMLVVADYALGILPALRVEATRQLPESGPRQTLAVRTDVGDLARGDDGDQADNGEVPCS